MTYFWIALAVVLIIVGLFLVTQGGDQIGASLTVIGVAIGLILAVCSTVHARRMMTSDAATIAAQAESPVAIMKRTM